MALLVLISLAQLGVLVLILAAVSDRAAQRQAESTLAGESIRSLQRQTIEAMFTAAAEDEVGGASSQELWPR